MHIIEVYLAINVIKSSKSGLAVESLERFRFPWKPWSEKKASRWPPLTPFLDWYRTLLEKGLSWEANKIFRLLLPSLNIDEVAELIEPRQLNRAVESVDGLKASEPVLLTVLTVANDILRYALASYHRDGIVGTKGLLEFTTPYYEVATTVVGLMFGPEPNDSEGRLVIQWKLAAEQMIYLKNAGIIDLNELHPLFTKLEIAAIDLEDIRLQAELIPATCWTDPESDSNPPTDAGWDLTRLAAPLHPLIALFSDVCRERIKKILQHHPPGWETTETEVWNLFLVTANEDDRYSLLVNLTTVLAETGAQMSNTSPALLLAVKLVSQSPNLVLDRRRDFSSIFHEAAQVGATPVLDLALKADKSRVEKMLNTRDFKGNTPLDYAIDNKQEVAIAKMLPVVRGALFALVESAGLSIIRMMAEQYPETIDVDMVRKVIEQGRSDVARVLLEIREPETSTIAEWEKLLPLAVQTRQPDVVEVLVSKFPKSTLRIDEDGHSVLWYNKSSSVEDFKVQQTIRNMIAPMIIRMASISEAKKALGEVGKYFPA
jgi:hypothetical protein